MNNGLMSQCNKCGEPVDPANDAVIIHMAAYPDQAPALVTAQARHFLPTANCPGSPSRAQYIEGQPRDTRYPYDPSQEQRWRDAYAEVLAERTT